MTRSPDRLRVEVRGSAAGLLADRLRLAIRDGYDDGGVLDDVLRQLTSAGNGNGRRIRGACRECGHELAAIPLVARCPACGGRHLVFTREEAMG